MQCDQVQPELDAYLQGALPSEEQAVIESHLSSCPSCSEEAAAMREIGQRLSYGLKQWVDQGVCPPEVMARLEASIYSARRQPWWKRWPAYASVAAVAALFLMAVVSVRLNFTAGQVASLPFVGSLAAQLLYSQSEVQAELPNAHVVQVNLSDVQNGMTLTVQRVSTNNYAMRIQYSLRGGRVDAQKIAPALTGRNGPVQLRAVATQGQSDQVTAVADFDPVAPGQPLTLTVGGTWHVTFTN